MAFSFPSRNPLPLKTPLPSSSSFVSPHHPHNNLNLPSSFKPFKFNPCNSHNTQTNNPNPNPNQISTQFQKKKRKPKPSFHDQIREKWSQKPVFQPKKLPWQQPQEQEEPSLQLEATVDTVSDSVSSDFEGKKFLGKLVDRCEIEEPLLNSDRNRLSDLVSDSVSSDADSSLDFSSSDVGDKITDTHLNYETKTYHNCDKNQHNSVVLEELCIVEEVESSEKVEGIKEENSVHFSSNVNVNSGNSLSEEVGSVQTKNGKASLEGFGQKRDVDRLPWISDYNPIKTKEERQRSKTELAEKTIPEHELKRLRNVAFRMNERIKVGAAGVTQALVDTIHEKWKIDEVVKLKFEGLPSLNMKRIHEILENKTKGLVIWRSGSLVVLFRGLNYGLDCVQTYVRENEVNMNKLPYPQISVPDTVRLPKDLSENEFKEMKAFDKMLEFLGPRFKDWLGPPPLPVDADLLPGVVPGYKPPFRLLPYGARRGLRDGETTRYRRLARYMPPHFALGRNRELQGLAAAMVKLWKKSAIAKIAIKRGVLNTNNDRMAEQLKKLTGGTLLSRNKEYIVFYRGNDFLTPSVTEALEERERLTMLQHQEEETRLYASGLINSNSKNHKTPMVAGTLAETLAATSRWAKQPSSEDVEKMLKNSAVARRTSLVKYLNKKLSMGKRKLQMAEKALAKVQKSLEPAELPMDVETITDEERLVFRKMGLSMKPYLLVGRREVFDGTIENMHLHWKYRELVKLIVKGKKFAQVKHIAISLEAESGGVVISIDKTTKGYAIIVYRGKNYQRPDRLRPRNLLTRRQALARSIELQRREGLKHHISSLLEQIELVKSGLEDMKDGKEVDDKSFYEKLNDDSSSPFDDENEEDEDEDEEAYLQTYDSGDEENNV